MCVWLLFAVQGHGDELCLADANFPAQSIAEAQTHPRIVRMPAADNVQLLAAILKLMPLDQYVEQPVSGQRKTSSRNDMPLCAHASSLVPPTHSPFLLVLLIRSLLLRSV